MILAKASGTNIEQRKMMDFAKLALKLKMKNKKGLKKILILINCSIIKELVNKKI